MASAFRQIGFQVIDGYDLDYANMRRVIADFLVNVAAAQVVVVYYAGHGVQLDGRNYLAPIDQLEPLLKPLEPRLFEVATPEQFRKALAVILAEIAKL